MSYKSDIEIAREANKKPIQEIGAKLGIPSEHLLPYGHDKAKVSQDFINSVQGNKNGKFDPQGPDFNPTPAGEERQTSNRGLGDGLNRIGKKSRRLYPRSIPWPMFPGIWRCRRRWVCPKLSRWRNKPAFTGDFTRSHPRTTCCPP